MKFVKIKIFTESEIILNPKYIIYIEEKESGYIRFWINPKDYMFYDGHLIGASGLPVKSLNKTMKILNQDNKKPR